MSDNITLNPGTSGDTVAADEIGGVKHQRVKVEFGADGSATDASTASPLPVELFGAAIFTDDAAFTPASSKVVMVGAEFDDSSPDSVNEGDAGALRMSSRREVYVQLRDAAGNERGLNIDANGAAPIGSVTPGTAATSLGKAVDSAAGATDTGVAMLAVRDDSLTTLTPADGDYVPLRADSTGNLWVSVTGAITGVADDATFNAGTTTVPVGFLADESSPDSVNEGDMGAARMSLDRKVYAIAHQETSTIYQNGTAKTPVFAAIDAATSGNNTLVSAQGASNKIRVHQLFLVSAGTVTVRFESGADGTALSGQMNLVANTGFVLPFSPIGWFETAANTLLNLELSGAISVDGNLAYTVVT